MVLVALEVVCAEYIEAILGSKHGSLTRDGVHSLTEIVGQSLSQVDEMNTILDSTERDTLVLRDALLPQLESNTQHLLTTFQTIDALGELVANMERTARATRDQVKEVQSAYDARHPKKVERFLGSLNMFRSKKDTDKIGMPPMPTLAQINIPDTSAAFRSIQNAATLS